MNFFYLRNKMILTFVSLTSLTIVILNLFIYGFDHITKTHLAIILPVLILSFLFIYNKVYQVFTAYLLLAGCVALMFGTNVAHPSIENIIFVFLISVGSIVYQNEKLTIVINMLAAVCIIVSLNVYGAIMLVDYNISHSVYFLVTLVMITVISVTYIKQTNELNKRLKEKEKKAIVSKEHSDTLLKESETTKNKLENFSKEIEQNMKESNMIQDTISENFNEMFFKTNEQAKSVELTDDLVMEIVKEIKTVYDEALSMKEGSERTLKTTHNSDEQIQHLSKDMHFVSKNMENTMDVVSQLNKKIKKINEMTFAINEISEQINLLSLNASIEAARAGEEGKGFKVISLEVKNLASYSKELVKEIETHIQDVMNITNQVDIESKRSYASIEKGERNLEEIKKAFIDMTENSKEVVHKTYTSLHMIERLSTSSLHVVEEMRKVSSLTHAHKQLATMILNNVEEQNNRISSITHRFSGLKN